jgi:LEA14-like dessication related protein
MMRKTFFAVIASMTLFSAGCATLGRSIFSEPIVSFNSMKLRGIGLTGGSLDLVLDVYNPNAFKLDATRLTYNLMIEDVKFGDGALDSRFTVQSGDTTAVTIPINFTFAGIGAAGRSLINTGSVNYKVLGDFTVNTPLGAFTRPYSQTGRYTAFGGR